MNPKKKITPHTYSSNQQMNKVLVFVSLIFIAVIAGTITLFPSFANEGAKKLFGWITGGLGSSVQILVLLGFIFALYIAISKYGNIKLGDQDPEYKTPPWIFMFICAGLGASTIYWAIIEWVYYYQDPGLGLEPKSQRALEFSVSFSFFHWGIGAWATYAVASNVMAYHIQVRKNKLHSLSGIISAIFNVSPQGVIGRIVDLVFLIASVGALTLSLVISVATLSSGFADLLGLPNNFASQAIMTIASATIFCLSAYIGIDKGMQSLSSVVGYGTLIFAAVLLFIGPTEFILNNITNSVGLIAQNFFEMSLSTDPFGSGSFTKGWTVYYWLWWISYAPGCALFVTRVSAGRKIREVICALIIGGGAGCWFFFGVLESYSIHSFLHNVVDMVGITNQASAGGGDGGNLAVVAFLSSLPFGKMFLLIFLLLMIIFLASHVDAIAYTMAATSTRNLEEGQDPSRNMKLFWCIVITLIPLAILYANAPLDTIKTSAVLTGLPFLIILLITVFGFVRWLLDDYGRVPSHIIDTHVVKTEDSKSH